MTPLNKPLELTLINQFFPPDFAATGQFMDELVRFLASSGMRVRVFTSQPSYAYHPDQAYAPVHEQDGNLSIHRCRPVQKHSRNAIGRLIQGLVFSAKTVRFLLAKREHCGDVLFMTSEPPFGVFFVAAVAALRRIPLVYLIYDFYPDVAVRLGWLKEGNPLLGLWRSLNRWVWKQSACIIVPCSTMGDRLLQFDPSLKPKLREIHNWCDPEVIRPYRKAENPFVLEQKLTQQFTVLYSGNLGRCHDLDTLLDAASLLRNEPIRFLFIGGGPRLYHSQQRVRELGLTNCQFLPYQRREDLPYSLNAGDLSIVSIDTGAEGLVAPSKFYSALAVGRPLAIICEDHSYLRQMISEGRCGAAFRPGEAHHLAEFIRHLSQNRPLCRTMGQSGRDYLSHRYTLEHCGRDYLSAIYFAIFQDQEIHQAALQGDLENRYQPIVDLKTGQPVGLEVLWFWRHPQRGLLSAPDFLPALERANLTPQLGWAQMRQAFGQINAFQSQGLLPVRSRLCVNWSQRQFEESNWLSKLEQLLAEFGFPSEQLMLELDDATLMADPAATTARLMQLKQRQIRVAINDFSNRFSSLSFLHDHSVTVLKVSPKQLRQIDRDRSSREWVRTILLNASNLGEQVIAVGVETPEQRQVLLQEGIHLAQGKLFGPAMPPTLLSETLRQWDIQAAFDRPHLRAGTPNFPGHAPSPITALVVEDDRLSRTMLRRLLQEEGFEVLEAENGRDGLQLARTHQPGLIFSDLMMAHGDGLRLIRRLRKQPGSQKPFIFCVSSLDDGDTIQQAFEAGADDYLIKPVRWPRLRYRLRRLRQQEESQARALGLRFS